MPATRRQARERALSLLYEADAKGVSVQSVLDSLPLPVEDFASELARGVEAERPRLDEKIAARAKGWDLHRMAQIDRTILQMACYELMIDTGTPTAAILNEAVELAKQYSTEQSGSFVNGVLAAIAEDVR